MAALPARALLRGPFGPDRGDLVRAVLCSEQASLPADAGECPGARIDLDLLWPDRPCAVLSADLTGFVRGLPVRAVACRVAVAVTCLLEAATFLAASSVCEVDSKGFDTPQNARI